MKNNVSKLITLILLVLQTLTGNAQVDTVKEVLIIGTMHQVPKVIKRSYRPLLKRAKAYRPEAIYVESPMPSDTLSLKHTYPKFMKTLDSLRQHTDLDPQRLAQARCKPLEKMTKADFLILKQHYTLQADLANAAYYRYLYEYGPEGSPQPTQEEDGDLTARLAIHLGLKSLRSMDNQWYRHDYHRAWAACNKADQQDGEIKHLSKLLSSLKLPEFFAAVGRRFGLYTNSVKTMTKYHRINSFRYRRTECAPCTEGGTLWDARNLEMARNIGRQIRANDQTRSVVIVGAGHVIGLREALQREFPDLKVRLLRE